jgi:hypothetical protein
MLVLVPGILGYITGNLWLFPSLGTSIFLQVVMPHQKYSRFDYLVIGHLIGVVSGYTLMILSGATNVPSAIASGQLHLSQVIASCIAVALMTLLQLTFKAVHPPAAATTLMITLGVFRATWNDFFTILIGISIVAVAGESIRRIMLSIDNHNGKDRGNKNR